MGKAAVRACSAGWCSKSQFLSNAVDQTMLGSDHIAHFRESQAADQRTFDTDLQQVIAQDLRCLVEQLLCLWHIGHHVLPQPQHLQLSGRSSECTS